MTSRAFDWESTPLGPCSDWSSELQVVSGLMFNMSAPSCLFWGSDGILVFNTAWQHDMGPDAARHIGRPVAGISATLAAAYQQALVDTAQGKPARLHSAVFPMMWRALVGQPLVGFNGTAVFTADGAVGGVFVTLGPTTEGNSASAQEICASSRHTFMLKLSDALRRLQDDDAIQALGTRLLAQELGTDRVSLTEMDFDAGLAREHLAHRCGTDALPHTIPHPLDHFRTAIQPLKNGHPLVFTDVFDAKGAPVDSVAAEILTYAKSPFRAQLTVPVFRADALVAIMTLRQNQPRAWSVAEIAMVHEASIRIWEAIERARAESLLRISESHHRNIFHALEEGVLLIEQAPPQHDGLRDYRVISMNAALQNMFDIPDLSGKSMRAHFSEQVDIWFDDFDRVIETAQSVRVLRNSFSGNRNFSVYVAPMGGPARRQLFVVMQDITARTHSDAVLRKSEARFRALVTATSNVIYRMGPDWHMMLCLEGRGNLRDSPYPINDWLDYYIEPGDQPEVMAKITEAVAKRGIFEMEYRVRLRDGSLGWFQSRAVPILDEQGNITEWFGAARDVTQRRRALEDLRAAEHRLRVAQAIAGVATFDWLIEANEGRWSPEFMNMLGLQPGALDGSFEDWISLIHPDDRCIAAHAIEAALEIGEFEGEWRLLRPDGEELQVLVRGIVERDSANRPIRLTGAQVDITEHVHSVQNLRVLIAELGAQIEILRRRLGFKDL